MFNVLIELECEDFGDISFRLDEESINFDSIVDLVNYYMVDSEIEIKTADLTGKYFYNFSFLIKFFLEKALRKRT